MRLILYLVLALLLFGLLYDIYKTRSYKRPRQVLWAVVGALLLAYLLFTCKTDNYFTP